MKRNVRALASALRVAVALMVFLLVGTARGVSAQENQQAQDPSQQNQKAGHGKVELLHVQGDVYMIAGAGANITVQVGNQFVIVVDSGVPQKSEEVLAAIRSAYGQTHSFRH
jgi:hypothetical protein